MDGKQCKKCREIKSLAQFKRRLSKAQSLARGYLGNVALEIESSLCKDCQPKRKSRSRLTARELRNRLLTGDINPLIAEHIIERRNTLKPIKQGMAVHKNWERRWGEDLKEILRPMKDEIRSVDRQLRFAQKTTADNLSAKIKFFSWYLATLRQQLARIELDYEKTPRQPPKGMEWTEIIEGTVRLSALDAWGEIPLNERSRLKQPTLLLHRRE